MADKKISELDALSGANTADDDRLVIVDTSAGLTKSITMAEFKNAFDSGSGFVRVTGDTMTGALRVYAAANQCVCAIYRQITEFWEQIW